MGYTHTHTHTLVICKIIRSKIIKHQGRRNFVAVANKVCFVTDYPVDLNMHCVDIQLDPVFYLISTFMTNVNL